RVLLALLPLGVAWAMGTTGTVGWIAAALFGVLPLAELVVTRVAPGRKLRVSNLPGITDTREPRFPVNLILVVDLVVTVLAVVLLLSASPPGRFSSCLCSRCCSPAPRLWTPTSASASP